MKAILLKTLLVVGIVTMGILSLSVKPKPAHCAWCAPVACFGPGQCGPGCTCMTLPGSVSGSCVSFGN